MSGKFKAAMLFVAATLVLALPLGAQSNLNTATAGIFMSDVDRSVNVHWFKDVQVAKWGGWTGYGSSYYLSQGYYRNIGSSVFLGTYYYGNILSIDRDQTVTVEQNIDLLNQIEGEKTTATTYTTDVISHYNRINALIGLPGAKMGFKVGFSESMTHYGNPSNHTVTVIEEAGGERTSHFNEIEDFNYINGSMTPSIEWGMHLEAGGIAIRPKASASLNIYQNEQLLVTRSAYDTVNGKLVGQDRLNYAGQNITSDGYNRGYLTPSFSVGAEFGLPSEKYTAVNLGITYGIDFSIYGNDYDIAGISGTADGTVSWSSTSNRTIDEYLNRTVITKTANLQLSDNFYISHSITPTFKITGEAAEGLKLGFSATVPVNIYINESDAYNENWTVTETKYDRPEFGVNRTQTVKVYDYNGLTRTTQTSFSASLALGASYDLVPNKFKVNAGVNVTPFNYSRSVTSLSGATNNNITTDVTKDANGTIMSESVTNSQTDDTITDQVTTTDSWSFLSASIRGGFVFNFNENLALDMLAAYSTGFIVDVASINILFTYKF